MFIGFANSTRQWVDIKLFNLPRQRISDREALGLVSRHIRYRDSYAGTGDEDMVDIHGPYRLDAITTDSFSAVGSASAEATLRWWAECNAALPSTARDELEHDLYARIRAATAVYQLTGVGEAEWHDWGYVVGMSGFNEFVLIDRAADALALVVASDD